MAEQKTDTYTAFMDTVDVVNSAVIQHRDKPVIRQLLAAADKTLDGKRFGVAVYRGDADTPHDYFTLAYRQGKLELASRGKDKPDIAWKVSQDYLREVSSNPQAYIDNPARLDLDWLKSRAGMSL